MAAYFDRECSRIDYYKVRTANVSPASPQGLQQTYPCLVCGEEVPPIPVPAMWFVSPPTLPLLPSTLPHPYTPPLQDRDANRTQGGGDTGPTIPGVLETDEEEEERLKKSYNNYLNLEKDFLVKLGLKNQDDPVALLH